VEPQLRQKLVEMRTVLKILETTITEMKNEIERMLDEKTTGNGDRLLDYIIALDKGKINLSKQAIYAISDIYSPTTPQQFEEHILSLLKQGEIIELDGKIYPILTKNI
jgi:hypothetical protein